MTSLIQWQSLELPINGGDQPGTVNAATTMPEHAARGIGVQVDVKIERASLLKAFPPNEAAPSPGDTGTNANSTEQVSKRKRRQWGAGPKGELEDWARAEFARTRRRASQEEVDDECDRRGWSRNMARQAYRDFADANHYPKRLPGQRLSQ